MTTDLGRCHKHCHNVVTKKMFCDNVVTTFVTTPQISVTTLSQTLSQNVQNDEKIMKIVDVVSKTHEHYVLFCGAMHVSVPIRVAQRVCVCTCYPLAQTMNLGKSRHGNFQAARRGCHALYMSWRRCCLPALSRHHPRSCCLPALSCQLKAFDSCRSGPGLA